MNKSAKLAMSVSKRFANSKQELAIQTTAGVIRDAVKGKGGHNSPRLPFERKDGVRVKKISYGKSRWGTLVIPDVKPMPEREELSFKVTKQAARARAYNDKITSHKWKKAAGDR